MKIEKTLKERNNRYGSFEAQAKLVQSLKRIVQISKNWPNMSDDKREAIETILLKISRICNGDPNYKDSWHDIVGYASIIEKNMP